MIKILSLLSSLALLFTLNAAPKVEKFLVNEIKSSLNSYNKLIKRSGVNLNFDKALYNKDKSKIKVVTLWKTKKGEQPENIVLKRDEFKEYIGAIKSSKKSKKSGFHMQIKNDDSIVVNVKAKELLKKSISKYAKMFEKANVGLYYSYALFNEDKDKIKLVVIWETKAGKTIENIILDGDEFGEFAGNFKASKKNIAKGKKGLPISITLDI